MKQGDHIAIKIMLLSLDTSYKVRGLQNPKSFK